MKHHRSFITIFVSLIIFSASPLLPAADDISRYESCTHCGMDRRQFASSRMLIEYEKGGSVGVCSLHCMAIEFMVTLDKMPRSIKVADMNDNHLLDAEQAYWIVGGRRPGIMAKRGKWAFAKKEDAEAFLKKNGGSMVSFEEAIKAAYEDIYENTRMIRNARTKK